MPSDHPLRRILPLVDTALTDLLAEFAKLYAPIGRPSVRIRLVRPQGQSGVLPVVMHFHGGGSWNRPARFATPAALAA